MFFSLPNPRVIWFVFSFSQFLEIENKVIYFYWILRLYLIPYQMFFPGYVPD